MIELFLFDDDSEELSSEETSKGSKVSEPNTGWTGDCSTKEKTNWYFQ